MAWDVVPVCQSDDRSCFKQVSRQTRNQLVVRTIIVVVQRGVRVVRVVDHERPPKPIAVLSACRYVSSLTDKLMQAAYVHGCDTNRCQSDRRRRSCTGSYLRSRS
jgi:hypothetical protein